MLYRMSYSKTHNDVPVQLLRKILVLRNTTRHMLSPLRGYSLFFGTRGRNPQPFKLRIALLREQSNLFRLKSLAIYPQSVCVLAGIAVPVPKPLASERPV